MHRGKTTTNREPSPPRVLHHVIVGTGAAVFDMHRPALALPSVQVVGEADLNAGLAEQHAEELGCPAFPEYRTMLAATRTDIVVIMTPHPYHAEIAIAALEAGCHVLCEKPMAVHVGEADAMIEAAEASFSASTCWRARRGPSGTVARRRGATPGAARAAAY